jgi:hypothetical protein
MNTHNNEIGKKGEITISQLLGGFLVIVVIAFIFNSGFRQTCLNMIGDNKSASNYEPSTPQKATQKQSDIKKDMDGLKLFFDYLTRTGLKICHEYSDAWQGAISSEWITPEDALKQAKKRNMENNNIPGMTNIFDGLKSTAARINDTGSGIQRSLATDCVGTTSELMVLVNQPRGSLFSFNATVDRLESETARLKGQLDVY